MSISWLWHHQKKPFVEAIQSNHCKYEIVNLSAAHRIVPGTKWIYGLPELNDIEKKIAAAKKIANPGWYATDSQAGSSA